MIYSKIQEVFFNTLNFQLDFSNLLTTTNNQGPYFFSTIFDRLPWDVSLILPLAPPKNLIFTTMSFEILQENDLFFCTLSKITNFYTYSPSSGMYLGTIGI